MPILIMGGVAFLVFVLVFSVMIAAALEERQNTPAEPKPHTYEGKPVRPAA